MKYTISIMLFLFSLNSTSQIILKNATIFKKDASKLTGHVKIVNDDTSKDHAYVVFKETNKSKGITVSSNDIINIEYNKREFVVRSLLLYNKQTNKIFEIVKKGNISILKLNKYYYLENDEYGLKDISYKDSGFGYGKFFSKGIITVYVNKCKSAHELAFSESIINQYELKKIIDLYNTCETFNIDGKTPSTRAIESASENDISNVLIGAGINYYVSDYSNLDWVLNNDTTENSTLGYNVNASFFLSPAFIQKVGFFKYKVGLILQKESTITKSQFKIYEKIKYVDIDAGLNFYLLKNDQFRPYIGVNGLMLLNKTKIDIATLGKNYTTKSSYTNFTYSINVGSNIKLNNSKFNINVEYCPGYKNFVDNLGAIAIDSDEYQDVRKVKTSFFSFNLSYFIF